MVQLKGSKTMNITKNVEGVVTNEHKSKGRDYMDMDFNHIDVEHNEHLSTVTITNLKKDRELTDYIITKIFLPIRKAYLKDEKYQAAPTVITKMHLKDKITIEFFGGSIVDDKITQQFVDDFKKHLEDYLSQGLPIEKFSQRLTKQYEVEHVDISKPRVLPKYARNLARFSRSAAVNRY